MSNEEYHGQDEVVNHVMGIYGHEKCNVNSTECVKIFKKKKRKNKNSSLKKSRVEPMEHEDIKQKRSHDDVEAGSGSEEDNKNNRKKPNHVIDKNENAHPNEKSIDKKIDDNNQLNKKRVYSYEKNVHKGPFSVFVRKINDKNNKNTWSDVDVAGILKNCKFNYKEISRISKNLWDVEFDNYQDANETIKNGLIKEFGFVAYIPRHKVIQTGVISNVVSWMDLEELVSAVKEDNKDIKIESAFRLKKKDPKTKKWLDTNSFGINFKGSSLPKKVYISSVRIDIKPYVYKVIRCYKCGRFGHLAKKCYVEDKCLNCGDKKHQLNKDNKCDKVSKCINCSQNHHCLNSKCSAFLEAKEINSIMATDNISFVEAQLKINKRKKKTYSEVIKQTNLSQSHNQSINRTSNSTNTNQETSKLNELLAMLPEGSYNREKFVEEIVKIITSFIPALISQNKGLTKK